MMELLKSAYVAGVIDLPDFERAVGVLLDPEAAAREDLMRAQKTCLFVRHELRWHR
jgi:hypothetical protein